MSPVVNWFLSVVAFAILAAVALAWIDLVLQKRKADREDARLAEVAAAARREAYTPRHSTEGDTVRLEIPASLRAAIGVAK